MKSEEKIYTFVSKNSNLSVVLIPGVKSEPLLGFPGREPLHLRFQDGVLKLTDKSIVDKLIAHNAFTRGDCILVEDRKNDPYSSSRKEIEPGHVMTEIEYGHVGKRDGTPKKVKLSKEIQEAAMDWGKKAAKEEFAKLMQNFKEQTKSNTINDAVEEAASTPSPNVVVDDIPQPTVAPEITSPEEAGSQDISQEALNVMNMHQVRAVAREADIKMPFGCNKATLIDLINQKNNNK